MKAESYFVDAPLNQVTRLLNEGAAGHVAAFSLRISGKKEQLQAMTDIWRERLTGLLGKPENEHVFSNGFAISVITRHSGGAISSIFASAAGESPCIGYEIVGTKALIVWDGDRHELSSMRTQNGWDIVREHAVITSLREGMPE